MSEDAGVDRVLSLVAGYAQACLDGLVRAGAVPRPEAAVHAGGGWRVLLLVCPTPAGEAAPDLTECDRACLTLLGQVTDPLSGVRARRELERRGLGIFG